MPDARRAETGVLPPASPAGGDSKSPYLSSPQHRVPRVREMDADLVRAAGEKAHLEHAAIRAPLPHPHARAGFHPPSRTVTRRSPAGVTYLCRGSLSSKVSSAGTPFTMVV